MTLIKLPDVMRMTALGRSSLYQMARDGRFPQPRKIGKHASAWSQLEVESWIANKINQSNQSVTYK